MQFKPQIILDSDPWIRDYIEVVYDTTPTTQSIVGFICKVCWKQFENSGSAFNLLAHAEMHKARQERPYQTRRRLFFSGEDGRYVRLGLSDNPCDLVNNAGLGRA